MHFTSAFISALLSASTVLAQGLSPYAGFRLAKDEAHTFKSITATFIVPPIDCRVGAIAYIGVAIGGPTCSGSSGIEAGVILKCDDTLSRTAHRAYWQSYPDIVHFWRIFKITQGDQIRVEVQVLNAQSGNVNVLIENLTTKRKLSPYPLDGTVGRHCQTTASWFLRAEVKDGELKPIPSFKEIVLYKLDARDITTNSYGTKTAQPVPMTNSKNQIVVQATRTKWDGSSRNRAIRIF